MKREQIEKLTHELRRVVELGTKMGAEACELVQWFAAACSQELTGADVSVPIATQLLAGAAARMAEVRVAAPSPTIRTCPCKFTAGESIAPTSPAWHRAHRIHHLAMFPNVDHGTRMNLDLLVEMAERGELTSRMFS